MTTFRLNDHVAQDATETSPFHTGIVTDIKPGYAEVAFTDATGNLTVEEVPDGSLHLVGRPTKADPRVYVTESRGARTSTEFYAPHSRGGVTVHYYEPFRGLPREVKVNWSALGSVNAADARTYASLISAAADFAEELQAWATALDAAEQVTA